MKVQITFLVLCYSRMVFLQIYPRFTRLECKAFLTEALSCFAGTTGHCMLDHTHVIVAAGSGQTMIPSPETVASGERYGFKLITHANGGANRPARVEAAFLTA